MSEPGGDQVIFAVEFDGFLVPSEVAGGKGAALAQLVRGGHRVPNSGVVTTAAYRAVLASNPSLTELVGRILGGQVVDDALVDRCFREATLPTEVEEAITRLAKAIGDGCNVAVRSSATVEDLAGSSFAGQYRSVLNVDSQSANAAVRDVWASLWHTAPTAYRAAFGIDQNEVAMGVVLMEMIPATTAGVVFTADPGGSNGARVEAVEGLGESLVSGERTPNAWIVPVAGPSPSDLPLAANRALQMALAIERQFGVPQDVEWAAVDDQVHVVQARPITVLETDDGFDSEVDNHELTTAGIAEMVPGVQPVLCWELNAFLLEEAFRSVLDSLGVLHGAEAADSPFIRRVRGRVALDFDQLRDAAAHLPGAVERLEHQYFGRHEDSNATEIEEVDQVPRRNRVRGLWQDVQTFRTQREAVDAAEVLIRSTAALSVRRPVLETFEDEALLAYIYRLVDLAARGLGAELAVAAAGAAAYDRLVALLDRHLGAEAGSQAALAAIAQSGAETKRQPLASAAVFAGPTWVDLGIAPPEIASLKTSARATALEHLESQLTRQPGWKRRRVLTGQIIDVRVHVVRRSVREVVEQLQRREAAKAAVLELGGEVRRALLEGGARLVRTGVLTDRGDVELLTSGELKVALTQAEAVYTDVLGRRRNWLSRYQVEGELPVRFRGVPRREPMPLPEGDVLEGWAASPGRYQGSAAVMDTASGAIEPGQVLVAAATDASWSPLFVKASAIVVERGGPLSHAAILARELGLPAVLNVEGATSVLAGRVVTVDGDQGKVVIERGKT